MGTDLKKMKGLVKEPIEGPRDMDKVKGLMMEGGVPGWVEWVGGVKSGTSVIA